MVENGAEMAGMRNDGGSVAVRDSGALKTPLRTVLHVQCIAGGAMMGRGEVDGGETISGTVLRRARSSKITKRAFLSVEGLCFTFTHLPLSIITERKVSSELWIVTSALTGITIDQLKLGQ